MPKNLIAIGLCLVVFTLPNLCPADSEEYQRSYDWATMIHEENSVLTSVLFFPYMILRGPVRMIGDIINPKPVTRATVPPPAHRTHR